LHGNTISRGIAIGGVYFVKKDLTGIVHVEISRGQVESEVKRLMSAISLSKLQLRRSVESIPETTSQEVTAVVDTQLLMLDDQSFSDECTRIIEENLCNAEWALKQQRDHLLSIFDEIEDQYLRTRGADIKYVVDRIIKNLIKRDASTGEIAPNDLKGMIVLADDLSPTDVILLKQRGVEGFATEAGGATSHTSILARSLSIPAITGLRFLKDYFKQNDTVIVDGELGVILGEADGELIDDYELRRAELDKYRDNLKFKSSNSSSTLDGIECALYANVELSSDFSAVVERGAKGVGLYRTEFLFINRESLPDETEQYQSYVLALDHLKGKELTIRTADLAWKQDFSLSKRGTSRVSNSALVCRGIRAGLKNTGLLMPQLKAIIRASAHGSVRMMLPMVSSIDEVRAVKKIIVGIQDGYRKKGISFDPIMPVGAMIEVPAAAICAEIFAEELDFLAIGSNDLTQYVIAVDRDSEEIGYLRDPLHPAVLRLFETTIIAAKNNGIRVSLCGELASDTRYTKVLLALGLTEFSVCPANLREVNEIINRSEVEKLRPYAKAFLSTGSLEERERLLVGLETA
jgi:phosphotransferase system enzyme I (PtsI)